MGRAVRVGLIGFGTIGTGVIRLLQHNRSQLQARLGASLTLAGIADVDLRTDRGVKVDRSLLTSDALSLIDDPTIDVVIELIGGYEPARRFVLRAICNGKSVVTANKALLAVHGAEIFARAEEAGVDIGYEASVAGGIPIIRTLKEGLAGDRTLAMYGIVNGTSNYVLSTMTQQGGEFAAVLRDAQRQGLAEGDPTYDVDGIDAAHKLTLLIQLGFGAAAHFAAIPVEGIRHVTQLDISFAREFGYVIKLLAIAKQDGRQIEARVHPTMVPRQHLLADVGGAYNAIAVQGEALGASIYFGLGAGMLPTATAVLADLLEVARGVVRNLKGRVAPLGYPLTRQRQVPLKSIDDLITEYYLRFMVLDRPGVLARLSGILGRHEISIASVIQKQRERGASVPVVIRTHHARERNVRRALRAIDRLAVVRGRSTLIRIENSLGE
ncbi:MAG: homoserine dehydrogenase [Candidatus Binatia bacterium]